MVASFIKVVNLFKSALWGVQKPRCVIKCVIEHKGESAISVKLHWGVNLFKSALWCAQEPRCIMR